MSDTFSEVQATARWCPVCPDELGKQTLVEPEQDGDHLFYECEECGYAFGYERITEGRIEGSCALGIPENVRKAAQPMNDTGRSIGTVDLGVTISKRPGL